MGGPSRRILARTRKLHSHPAIIHAEFGEIVVEYQPLLAHSEPRPSPPKPRVFIASSTEGLELAEALHDRLQKTCEVTVWNQGHALSISTLEAITQQKDLADFGIFVLCPNDVSIMRKKRYHVARDNVIFELGLFIGKLGISRCFMVLPDEQQDLHLPSDLLGLTYAVYESGRSDGNHISAVNPAAVQIRKEIQKQGLYRAKRRTASARNTEDVNIDHLVVEIARKTSRRNLSISGLPTKKIDRSKPNERE